MSIIVKGMDMPTECRECPFAKFGIMSGETYCWVNGVTLAKNFEVISFDGRPDWCPLVALPDKHGDLIDKGEFKKTLDYYIREAGWSDEHNEALTWVKDDFIDAEMIIVEAEGGE